MFTGDFRYSNLIFSNLKKQKEAAVSFPLMGVTTIALKHPTDLTAVPGNFRAESAA
jgi:hypothetical protein